MTAFGCDHAVTKSCFLTTINETKSRSRSSPTKLPGSSEIALCGFNCPCLHPLPRFLVHFPVDRISKSASLNIVGKALLQVVPELLAVLRKPLIVATSSNLAVLLKSLLGIVAVHENVPPISTNDGSLIQVHRS